MRGSELLGLMPAGAAAPILPSKEITRAPSAIHSAEERILDRQPTVVLIFHGIGEPPSGLPAEEQPYWITEAQFRDIISIVQNEEAFSRTVLTFDDGNGSDLFAASELVRAGLTGIFFILTGRFGKSGSLDRSAVRDIARAGFEIGLHGHSHVNWRRNSESDWQREVVDSRKEVENLIGGAVNSVAIPYGYYDRRVLRHLRTYRFDKIFTSDRGVTRSMSGLIRRSAVMRSLSADDVRGILRDEIGPLRRARRTIAPLIKCWR